MEKTEQVVVNEFAGVRTGKASSALVENILVDSYGSQMRIRELAGITTPEPRMLVIQPWDAGTVTALATGLGAIPVILMGTRAATLRPLLLGIAAGVMIVASVLGLIAPALARALTMKLGAERRSRRTSSAGLRGPGQRSS